MLSLAQTLSDARADLPTSLDTAGLRELGADILRQSIFSARMSNATAVQGIRSAVQGMLLGKGDGTSSDNLTEARLKLRNLIQSLGYDPSKGFPGENAEPAEPGSLRDLLSFKRLNLILETQQRMTQGAAKNIWGNEPDALEEYPAWELVRIAAVATERGEKRTKDGTEPDPENSWEARFEAAAKDAGDDEALGILDATGRMVARKDSPIWGALGEGAGGYDDTLGNDYEPFAYNSGMGREELSRKEFAALGGDVSTPPEPADTSFGPDEVSVPKSRFDPDILKTLQTAMASGDLKYRVKVTAS